MSKSLALVFAIASIASARAQVESQREYVVSAVACEVGDPRELGAELGLKAGNRIIVESLNTRHSTIFIEDEAYVTGFPADLKFTARRFRFEGTEVWDELNHLSLRIEGEIVKRRAGYLFFEYRVDDKSRVAMADLINCTRHR